MISLGREPQVPGVTTPRSPRRGRQILAAASAAASDASRYFSIIRETPQRLFREHQVTIDDDLEDTICTLDEARRSAEFLVQLGRQPGGPWFVVSNDTVFD